MRRGLAAFALRVLLRTPALIKAWDRGSLLGASTPERVHERGEPVLRAQIVRDLQYERALG